jgi:hypothetical protein
MRYSAFTVRWGVVTLNPLYTYTVPFLATDHDDYFYQTPIVTKCVIKRLYFTADIPAAVGSSWRLTLYVNGVASSLSIDITSSANYVEETANEITLNAGDYAYWTIVPIGAPGNIGKPLILVDIENEDNSGMLLSGDVSSVSSSNAYYSLSFLRSSSTELDVQCLVPTKGKLTDVIGRLQTAPRAGKSRKFTVRVNGINTGLILTISDTAITGTASGEVDLVAGDLVSIYSERINSPAHSRVILNYKWVPDISGEMIYMHSGFNALETTSNNRYKPVSEFASLNSSEGIVAARTYEAMYKKFHTLLSVAPGAGKAYNFMFRDDSVDTDLDLSVADANVSNSNTTDEVLVEDKSILTYKVNGVNTPTASIPKFGIVGYKAEAGGTPLRRLMGVGL